MKSLLAVVAVLALFTAVNSFGQTLIEYQTTPKNGGVVDRFEGASFEVGSLKTDFNVVRVTATIGTINVALHKTTGVWTMYVDDLHDLPLGPTQVTFKIYYTENDFVPITVDFILEGDSYIDFYSPKQYATFATTLPVDVNISWDTDIDEVTASVGANTITLTLSSGHYVGNVNISALAIDTFDIVVELTDINTVKHSYTTQFIHDTKPRVKDISAIFETKLTFTAKMFTDSYTGPGALAKVKIVTLPTHGTLTRGGFPVVENQEISNANLSTLKYESEEGFEGLETLTWNASDGTSYADNTASIKLNVAGRPLLTNITLSNVNFLETHFNPQTFIDAYSYVKPFEKLRIVKLPKYSGFNVIPNNPLITQPGDYPLDQLKDRDFYYRPLNQLDGADTIAWNVVTNDGTTAAEDAYVIFTYDLVFPTIDPDSFEGDENEEITFSQDDFLESFHSDYDLDYVSVYGNPAHGKFITEDGSSTPDGLVFLNKDTRITYQPDEGFNGVETLEWGVRDISGVYAQGTAPLTFIIGNVVAGLGEDAFDSSIKVSPIPAKDYIDIELKANLTSNVSIIDMTGRRVTPVLQNNRVYFSENNITRGMYILAVKSNSRVAYRKFIVE